ncbi:hypothetical protein [Gallibacterium anatis]|uniref:Uncharacterized protein n=1 Tax=Gallibacterium anatis TaxID=750 RepID=A0A0A2XHR9_9PAST|nr:hypothetical protein [Gallibacterium anatis]KGQ31931.1 hypothetical protein JP32_06085 [Gallibacterium anatis]KGQ56568.1 hypothetical protein IE01_06350 [Gallibacterium anatis DSM 16844 = F 149]OBW96708.1 hypothetical protein QV02_03180 [Gallibacterium anatis]OBW98047.1 hypothetical protein QV03_07870 [Gallibacterium anatis]STO38177.1 Uncharacterised protein [Gallibacterium anatis]
MKIIFEMVSTAIITVIALSAFFIVSILGGMIYTTYPITTTVIGVISAILFVLWLIGTVFNRKAAK